MFDLWAMRSLKLRGRVAVALECAIDHIGAMVVHVWHDRLVHGTIPLHVAWVSVSVPVAVLVVLMEHRLLTSLPLAVSIRNRWVGRQHASDVPVEQLRVVGERLRVESVVVQEDRSVPAETTADTSHDEVHNPNIGQTAANVEVSDGQFTDSQKTKKAAQLSARGVVGLIEVRAIDRACHLGHLALREP